jgi:CTP:molybdopterin cytidylyltransferase MocA
MISAVVLAAGAATRFGSAKQLLLLPHVLGRLEESPLDEIVVVSGAYPIEEGTPALGRARVVACRDWARGPGASLRCGLAALDADAEAALVVLADGPRLDPRAIERVLAHRSEASVVAASYNGVRGHPALFARHTWATIPDEGGRSLGALLIACDDLTPPGDVDTPDLMPSL